MRVTLASIAFATYAALVSADACAQQPAGYDSTPGILAISSPDTTSPVTAGSQATIKWDKLASTASTVSISLCKGPSKNCVSIACITGDASNAAGYFTWNVPSDLVASGPSGGYGLKIIENGSGRFQYSTQFGVLNNNNVVSSSAAISPVQQITDGQVQQPTSTGSVIIPSAAITTPKYTASGSELATNIPFPTGTAGFSGYGFPAPSGKTSNATHSSGFKFTYGPNSAPAGAIPLGPIPTNLIYQTATGSVAVPSSLRLGTGTQTVGGSAGGFGSPSGPTAAQSSIVLATGAAQKMVAGGFLAGLGAAAALVL